MPNTLRKDVIRLLAALLKHQAQRWLGEEFIDRAGDVLADLGAERLEAQLDRWLGEEGTAQQLVEAARRAEAHVLRHCTDQDLRGLFSNLDYGTLPEVQQALRALPKAMDAGAVEQALLTWLERDAPSLPDATRRQGARLYAEALQAALLPIKEHALPILGQMVLALREEMRQSMEKIEAQMEEIGAQLECILHKLEQRTPLSEVELQALRSAVIQGQVRIQGDAEQSIIIIGSHNRVTLSGTSLRSLRKVITLPGDLPPASQLPFPRNRFFTGRLDALQALTRALLDGGDAATGVLIGQALTGMGGVGKTQLAVEFAYRYGYRFRGVHWLDLRDPATLEEQIAAQGRRLGLQAKTQDELVAATLDHWTSDGPRLLILDNFEDLSAANVVLACLHHSALRLLITSRRADWPPTLPLEHLPLEEFSSQESLAFLRRYLPPERATEAELQALAARLGHLPLALDLAARYLAHLKRVSVRDYLGELERALAHPSMQAWRPDLPSLTNHDLSLLQTFAVSWEQVRDENARRYFMLAGYLAPNAPIPAEIPTRALDLPARAIEEAAAFLEGLGLLKEGPALHPLLAEFARHLDAESALLPPLAEALADLASATNDRIDQSGTYALFAPLLPHVRAVAERAEQARLPAAGRLWNSLGYHLQAVADYRGARECFARALRIDEAAFGPDHPNVARDVNNLGRVLQDLGDLAGARECFARALRIDKAAFGPDHPEVATDVNNLGSVLQALGDLASARECFARALRIWERALPPEHPYIRIARENLALVKLMILLSSFQD